jgi:alpha-galactosidase
MAHKISIIGAGSAVFSLGIIRDICLTPSLDGSTISFMDIDQGRLDAIHALCSRYAQEIGISLDLQKTTDRRESLAGAEVVVNAALVAGHHRLRAGWEVARRHGYRWGGSLHVMHDEAFWINFYQLRLFDSLIADVLDVCPDAWYIQSANPVQAGITYLARRYPRAKLVGLCHGYGGVYHIARVLGLEREHLTFELPGVNHFIWLTRLFYKGQDAMPLLDEWIAERAPRYWETCGTGDELGPKKVDLYRRLGAYPIGDTAGDGGGSWGWWYHTDDATERRWREDPGAFWRRFFSGGEQEVAEIARISADTSIRVTEHFPARMSGESIVPMVEALLCDMPRVIISNIPNSGEYVPGIPRDFQVEVPALVSRRGVQGIQTGGLPPAALSHLLRDTVAPVNLELAAYERGDRGLLLELLMQDPWTHSADQARAMLDEILALPFHSEMREHYR